MGRPVLDLLIMFVLWLPFMAEPHYILGNFINFYETFLIKLGGAALVFNLID